VGREEKRDKRREKVERKVVNTRGNITFRNIGMKISSWNMASRI
jgi:hypothetical protein